MAFFSPRTRRPEDAPTSDLRVVFLRAQPGFHPTTFFQFRQQKILILDLFHFQIKTSIPFIYVFHSLSFVDSLELQLRIGLIMKDATHNTMASKKADVRKPGEKFKFKL